jgi:hypothetical protein
MQMALVAHAATLTYEIPTPDARIVRLGRASVPVGRKLAAGFIVGLRDRLAEGSSLNELRISRRAGETLHR